MHNKYVCTPIKQGIVADPFHKACQMLYRFLWSAYFLRPATLLSRFLPALSPLPPSQVRSRPSANGAEIVLREVSIAKASLHLQKLFVALEVDFALSATRDCAKHVTHMRNA